MDIEINPLDRSLAKEIQQKIDLKTKPQGSLGKLEEIALQIALIQKTSYPILQHPTIMVFAGDHGIAEKGEVNPFPQSVTAQMVFNFLQGGAAINGFCDQHNIALKIVDAGVKHNFENIQSLIQAKIDFGTKNYQIEPAMTAQQCELAMSKGAALVLEQYKTGCNTIGFGEMGIGNTSSASLLMSHFTTIPIEDCIGAGTGLKDEGIHLKKKILKDVFNKYHPDTPLEALTTFGGFEIAMATGAILKAASLQMTILIDGFIISAALLVAHALHINCLDYCIFAHTSGEQGHQKILNFLQKEPILNLQLRLGEGTGAAIAYPLLKSAVLFLTNMASFEDAGVSSNT